MKDWALRIGAKTNESSYTGYIYGLIAGICYGAWAIIAKTAITEYEIPPLLFASIAFLFGTIIFSPILAYDLPRAFSSSRRAVALYALSGVGSGSAIVALSFALEEGDVSVVAPIVSVSPLITLILVRLFLDRLEKVSWRLVTGALIVVAGTVMVVVGDTAI